MGSFEKVTITRIENAQLVSVYTFTLNPSVFDRSRAVKFTDLYAPGTTSGQAQFVSVDSEQLTLKLKLSSTRRGGEFGPEGILPDLEEIESFALPALSPFLADNYQYTPPPTLLLTWGSRTWQCTVRQIDISELLHNKYLAPILADVTLKLTAHLNSFDQLRSYLGKKAAERKSGQTITYPKEE